MNIQEVRIGLHVPTVLQDRIDDLLDKQMSVVRQMGDKWLLHPDKRVRKMETGNGLKLLP